MFAILQKYEFSSKSQPKLSAHSAPLCCLRYCKSTSFQANHNGKPWSFARGEVVCDTAKVRVFKQITTIQLEYPVRRLLFAILQKYEFSSKSQREKESRILRACCLRYCKSTSFQANHNDTCPPLSCHPVVCDTAKVRVFKQITTMVVRL